MMTSLITRSNSWAANCSIASAPLPQAIGS
jgi:hypothetical protein